jgi:hypothetical protein
VDVGGRQDIPGYVRRYTWLLCSDLPSGCVALKVFALPFQHTSSNLCSSRMMFARVPNVLEPAQRQVRVDKVRIAPHKPAPLLISGHSKGTGAKLLDSGVHLVGVTLQDARKCVVCFLDFANDDRLQFTARVFEIKIGLVRSVGVL